MSVIALAAGGTAGHIEPAIACAKAIKEIDNNANVFIVGTSKGLELVNYLNFPKTLLRLSQHQNVN